MFLMSLMLYVSYMFYMAKKGAEKIYSL